jgi:hypothetical protein
MNSEGEMLFVSSRSGNGGQNHVHTDPECPFLQRSKTVHEKPSEVVDGDAEYCRACSGEWSPGENSTEGSDPKALRQTLAATAPEDLGLSALGERPEQGGESQ